MVIDPITGNLIAQTTGLDAQTRTSPGRSLITNPFEEVLSRAVDSLNGVSQTEFTANNLINQYVAGRAELSDVMVATSKMNIAVQMAVTVITTAVSTFKEITQRQI
jgi:flagellar hook-basal body complex protein FliE